MVSRIISGGQNLLPHRAATSISVTSQRSEGTWPLGCNPAERKCVRHYRLDMVSALMHGLPQKHLQSLQRVQNWVARLIVCKESWPRNANVLALATDLGSRSCCLFTDIWVLVVHHTWPTYWPSIKQLVTCASVLTDLHYPFLEASTVVVTATFL